MMEAEQNKPTMTVDELAEMAARYVSDRYLADKIANLEAQLAARDAEIAEMKRNVANHCTNYAPCYKMKETP